MNRKHRPRHGRSAMALDHEREAQREAAIMADIVTGNVDVSAVDQVSDRAYLDYLADMERTALRVSGDGSYARRERITRDENSGRMRK